MSLQGTWNQLLGLGVAASELTRVREQKVADRWMGLAREGGAKESDLTINTRKEGTILGAREQQAKAKKAALEASNRMGLEETPSESIDEYAREEMEMYQEELAERAGERHTKLVAEQQAQTKRRQAEVLELLKNANKYY